MPLKDSLRPLHHKLRKSATYSAMYDTFFKKSNSIKPKKKPKKNSQAPVEKVEYSKTAVDNQKLIDGLVLEGEVETAQMVINHLIKSAQTTEKINKLRLLHAKAYQVQGQHEIAVSAANDLIQAGEVNAHFVKAESLFLLNRIEEAWSEIQACLFANVYNADVIALACTLAERHISKEYARALIHDFIPRSKRAKPWLIAANLVDSNEDLTKLILLWRTRGKNQGYNKDIYEYVALAALRGGNASLAKSVWRQSLFEAISLEEPFKGLNVRTPSYSSKRAEKALIDLNNFFHANNIEMFLVSGTLLGCIRENALLGHDKDIDVGVWDACDKLQLLERIRKSGLFMELRSRSEEILRLKHVNGINIDVFYHFQEPDDYWHGGVKMKWHNTPFQLETRSFLDEKFLIPTNAELYLAENYGDTWREPIKDFDSAFDTPNGEILDQSEMTIHCFKGLLNACISNNQARVIFYLDELTKFGEVGFVEKYRDALINAGILESFTNDDTN